MSGSSSLPLIPSRLIAATSSEGVRLVPYLSVIDTAPWWILSEYFPKLMRKDYCGYTEMSIALLKEIDSANYTDPCLNSQSMKEVVAHLIDEARRRAGSDGELSRLIEPLVGRAYGKQAVSHWALGRAMPPAVALLAACKATGLSVDAALFGEEAVLERLQAVEEALRDLQRGKTDH
jgi:hypothetical protein